ncbi:MAG: DUF3151 domain-containing protein [Corynebacteriales bacterium]|nr:DUF3151 domain-containing protein [Mycobacteriales bacterium]
MTMPRNLMPEPPSTFLPADEAADAALEAAAETGAYAQVAADHPTSSAAWAALADRELSQGPELERQVTAYAYARTGYHRGLDALRRNGWKGHGPVPWAHHPNRGFLQCLALLARTAGAINEVEEAARCAQFLADCDPAAADQLS